MVTEANEAGDFDVNGIEWVYCIVGNIVEKHELGENKEIRFGTKHFVPGTKVYCLPHLGFGGVAWDNIVVMGKPRKRFKLIKIVIQRKFITNFRLKKVYDRKIIEEMGIFDQSTNEENKEKLIDFIKCFNRER